MEKLKPGVDHVLGKAGHEIKHEAGRIEHAISHWHFGGPVNIFSGGGAGGVAQQWPTVSWQPPTIPTVPAGPPIHLQTSWEQVNLITNPLVVDSPAQVQPWSPSGFVPALPTAAEPAPPAHPDPTPAPMFDVPVHHDAGSSVPTFGGEGGFRGIMVPYFVRRAEQEDLNKQRRTDWFHQWQRRAAPNANYCLVHWSDSTVARPRRGFFGPCVAIVTVHSAATTRIISYEFEPSVGDFKAIRMCRDYGS